VTDIPSFRDAPDLEVVGISSGTSITNNINIIIIIPSSGTCLYLSRCTYTESAFPDTVDPQERLSAFAKKHGITYPLLSDPDKKVQLAYGVKSIMFGLVRGTPQSQSQSQSQTLRSATVLQYSTFCQSEFAEIELATFSLIGRETFFIDESGRIIDRHIENYAFSAM
jgi:hypothetical protein